MKKPRICEPGIGTTLQSSTSSFSTRIARFSLSIGNHRRLCKTWTISTSIKFIKPRQNKSCSTLWRFYPQNATTTHKTICSIQAESLPLQVRQLPEDDRRRARLKILGGSYKAMPKNRNHANSNKKKVKKTVLTLGALQVSGVGSSINP